MTFEYYDGWVRRELWALSWMHSHGAMLIVTNAGSASDVLPSSKSIATCKPKGSSNVRPPTGFRFPTPHCKRGAPGKIGLTDRKFKRHFTPPLPPLASGSPPRAAAAYAQRWRLPQHAVAACRGGEQQGVVRLSAAWTGRAGWVTLRTHGFPGLRASGRPVGRSWRGTISSNGRWNGGQLEVTQDAGHHRLLGDGSDDT